MIGSFFICDILVVYCFLFVILHPKWKKHQIYSLGYCFYFLCF